MKELANISAYSFDTEAFGGNWQKILDFHRLLGLDGLEVLTTFDGVDNVPREVVEAVHLPFWMDWMPLWHGQDLSEDPLDAAEQRYFRGACSWRELVGNVKGYLQDASGLDPSYAVFHLCNTTVDEVLTGRQANGSHAVLEAAAELMNEVVSLFPGNKPPVRIFFENLWWEGLTFTDVSELDFFASSLSFSNWAFLLDTGHLMNTTTCCGDEQEAADYVLTVMRRLPEDLRSRIEGMHLCLSLSGGLRSSPHWFETTREGSLRARIDRAWEKMALTDEHRPFSSPACRRIVDEVAPRYLTHEFLSRTPAERRSKILTQRRALGKEV